MRRAETPRIVYTKSFPRSNPAFVSITVDKSGAGEYREAADDDNPLKFQLRAEEAAEIFGLAEKLDYFNRPLEAPVKVAFMGMKSFRYEGDGKKSEVEVQLLGRPRRARAGRTGSSASPNPSNISSTWNGRRSSTSSAC